MHKRLNIIFFALLSLLVVSCDQITGDFTETPTTDTTSSDSVVQKVVLEDYTGYTCGNCPAAHDVIKQIVKTYGERVIPIAVHAGSFAEPDPKHPYDFRTPEGNAYDEFFGNSKAGLPNGMINRKKFNNSYITRHTKWASLVAGELEQTPTLGIKLTANYNPSSRKISVSTNLNYLKNSSAQDYLVILMVEDSIIHYQKDYRLGENQDILNYVHNHVLRGSINSTWGERISNSEINSGRKFSYNHTYTIPTGKDWKPENMKIIAFVYSKSLDYQILQAEEVPLIKK